MKANLYLDQVNLRRYWPADAPISSDDFMDAVKAGTARIDDYSFLTRRQKQALKLVLDADTLLPEIPLTTMPQPVPAELIPVNMPDDSSLVIATGNSRYTLEVLTTIWSWGNTPAYFLLVDCLGNTADMAMVYGEFTPERLQQALKRSGLENLVRHRHLIVPGFTAPLKADFARMTGWEIEVGPVCAVELPLFLGDRWTFVNPR
jgi:CO dehydrogenase/acetyl-CoA synthase gamma subunit (corrinoid Fe-S protein)